MSITYANYPKSQKCNKWADVQNNTNGDIQNTVTITAKAQTCQSATHQSYWKYR